MSSNLDRLLIILKEQADLIDKLNTRSDFQYKSTQKLILDYGKRGEMSIHAETYAKAVTLTG